MNDRGGEARSCGRVRGDIDVRMGADDENRRVQEHRGRLPPLRAPHARLERYGVPDDREGVLAVSDGAVSFTQLFLFFQTRVLLFIVGKEGRGGGWKGKGKGGL